ncbi:hypothetical protein BMS3Abin13_00014 [bacterium BMS3Abin13]|nr:hypothetical protein BMS3Abin13_00014 [bacterium BMS3Abin13]
MFNKPVFDRQLGNFFKMFCIPSYEYKSSSYGYCCNLKICKIKRCSIAFQFRSQSATGISSFCIKPNHIDGREQDVFQIF